MRVKSRYIPALIACSILALISIFVALGLGVTGVSHQQLLSCLQRCDNQLHQTILFDIRLPRVIAGFLAGAGLAVAGALMQNVTRNPLADPYLFGIVAGAGLGATLATLLPPHWQVIGLPLSAFIGALFAVAMVVAVLTHNNWRRVEHLLLAGVAVSFLLSSITSFILYTGDAFSSNRVIFWLMGSLASADSDAIWVMLPVVLLAITVSLILSRQLDALLLSDESAKTLGVNVDALRLSVLILCALVCAIIVSFCGGIGFVGLMIPHVVRNLLAITSFKLIVFSALIGGSFLVWVDVLARTLLDGQEIPIGVITSALGSIFFLVLMRRMR
ncbi:iron ABC transporter permease [Thalassotalea sp. HSM 43]|uniref:FecCD family ABC transporter permease n=1 Tax=Thalassotalea sp. HSM 43 TaxID=2552945 RepID=UPI001081C9A4|nr:iron ABC transporter permease [Thalassotalea sp. HSM 43]QBY05683.1 iron ABC transporter permease [Thalassotalea sp. HSM 43]